jgi:hypothetical protein
LASELLFEAYTKYIEPLLNFGFITINEQGFIIEREGRMPLHYINDKYTGLEGEVAATYPVLPLSDEHYLAIRDNPEQELFNPFKSVKHMQLVTLQFKRGLINYCLSDKVGDDLPLSHQEELIRFYYNECPGKQFIVGFNNAEDPENPRDLYTYSSKDIIEAMWGLCVTAYNDLDRKHEDYFYTIDKTWVKIKRLVDKWDDRRKLIVPKMKMEHQTDFGFQNMNLSDEANNFIHEYPSDYYVSKNDMNGYIYSLFSPLELKSAVALDTGKKYGFTKEETSWQTPDFANPEYILGKNKKRRKQKKDIIDAEILEVNPPPAPLDNNPEEKITLIDGEYKEHILSEEQFETLQKEKPDYVEIEKDEEDPSVAVIVNSDEEPVVGCMPMPGNQNNPILPWVRDEKIIPPPGKKMEYSEVDLPNGEKVTVPHIVEENNEQNKPAPKVVYNPKPMMYPNPFGMPMQGACGYPYQAYPSPFYNQFGGYPNQGVPQDVNQIDFESRDHPDPFSNYR